MKAGDATSEIELIDTHLRRLKNSPGVKFSEPFATGKEAADWRVVADRVTAPEPGEEDARAIVLADTDWDESLVDAGPEEMARVLAARAELSKHSPAYEKHHRGGGGGNKSTGVLWFRYCSACDRQWKRGTIRYAGGKKSQVVWTPVCQCKADYIERLGTAQLMGAKSRSNGSRGQKNGSPKKRIPKTSGDHIVAGAGGALTDLERVGSKQPLRYIRFRPDYFDFLERSGLDPRDVLAFATMNSLFTDGSAVRMWSEDIAERKERDRVRGPNDRGGKRLYGERAAREWKGRLHRDLEATLRLRFGIKLEKKAGPPTLTHFANMALELYVWFVIELRCHQKFPHGPLFEKHENAIALVTSNRDECLRLSKIVTRPRSEWLIAALEASASSESAWKRLHSD